MAPAFDAPREPQAGIALDLDAVYRLSRFACLRVADGGFVLETPFNNEQLVIRAPGLLRVLLMLTRGAQPSQMIEGMGEPQRVRVLHIIERCYTAGMLAEVDPDGTTAEEHAPLAFWEFHDLYFHARSRRGRHTGPVGMNLRFEDRIPPLPALKAEAADGTVPLPRPDLDRLTTQDISLTEALETRRSRYDYSAEPLGLDVLGAFLYRCCRVKQVAARETGGALAFKVYPSGGAKHSLEVYPVIASCRGTEPGLYHYHAGRHHLALLRPMDAEVEQLLRDAQASAGLAAPPPMLLVVATRFGRTAWKYQGLAYRLVLAELGALYQTMYLVATAMGLAPCALGAGDADRFARLTGLDYYAETSVGEFILGPAAEA